MGLLSHTISVQNPQESMPLVIILEREEKNRERERRERGGRRWLVGMILFQAKRREERGEGYLWCPRRGPKYP